MKEIKFFAVYYFLSFIPTTLFAAVLDFDGYDTNNANYFITLANEGVTTGIGSGLQFTAIESWTIVISENYNSDWANGVSSGTNTMGMHNVGLFEREDGDIFNLNGAYLTSIYNNTAVTLQGLSGGSELFSSTISLNTGIGGFYDFNFAGIDQLIITNHSGGWLGIDDFTFSDGIVLDTTSVPEPTSIALLGLGLVGLGLAGLGFSRRKKD